MAKLTVHYAQHDARDTDFAAFSPIAVHREKAIRGG